MGGMMIYMVQNLINQHKFNYLMKNIKKWLKSNKIFFETITMVLIAVMAIIVSFQANQISYYQSELMNYQTEIMKAEYKPILKFILGLTYNEDLEKYTNEELKIINDGAPIRKFHSNALITFSFESMILNKPLIYNRIPIFGYYDTTQTTINFTGEIETSFCTQVEEGNLYKSSNIVREFSDYVRNNSNFLFSNAYLNRYVEVSYEDTLGDPHHEYYFVNMFGSYQITNDFGDTIKEEYETRALNFAYLTVEELYDNWLNLS